jgi:raffinose/stachyose/melibiose transport system substrate-binding protein
MRGSRKPVIVATAVAAALTIAACSSSGSSSGSSSTSSTSASASSSAKVTLTWWNNGNTQPLLGVWDSVAAAFHASHPNVTISVVPIQSDLFTTKMPIALKSDSPPDIFQQWGGGQEATQFTSGKLANLSSLASSWIGELGAAAAGWQVNGAQYGIPYDQHVVGFWYRTDLFQRAGISSPPTTIAQLESDDVKLKAAGITPIALGGGSRWPDAFFWEYFAVRECSESVLQSSIKAINMNAPCFSKATTDLTAFMATNPFQGGFNATQAQTGAGSSAGLLANGKAAMELQGDWETSVIPALTSNKNILSDLGWFPFPQVPGGAGAPTAVLSGGDGFSCTTGAPEPACAEFLQYIDSTPVQEELVQKGEVGLPANSTAQSVLTNPALLAAAKAHSTAAYDAEYFDIAFPTNQGQALDTALADFFAGKGSNSTIINSVSSSSGH